MKDKILCFWSNKRVFALDHCPKGRKRDQGITINLLDLFFITVELAIENKNGSKLLNHQKQPILIHKEIHLTTT